MALKPEQKKDLGKYALVAILLGASLVMLTVEGHASFYQFLAWCGALAGGIIAVKFQIGKI